MGKNSIRYPSKLGDAIKKARKEKGWTLAKVAQKLNTNGTLIGEYERGLKLPNVYMAFDLAQVLGFDLSEVLRDGETERQRDRELSRMRRSSWRSLWSTEYMRSTLIPKLRGRSSGS